MCSWHTVHKSLLMGLDGPQINHQIYLPVQLTIIQLSKKQHIFYF